MADPTAAPQGGGRVYRLDSKYDHTTDLIEHVRAQMRGAHFVNIIIRKNGQDIVEEGDWLTKLEPVEASGTVPGSPHEEK